MAAVDRTVKTPSGQVLKVRVPEEWGADQVKEALVSKGVDFSVPTTATQKPSQEPVSEPDNDTTPTPKSTQEPSGEAGFLGKAVQAHPAFLLLTNPVGTVKDALDIVSRPAIAVESTIAAGVSGENARTARDKAFFEGERTPLGGAILDKLEEDDPDAGFLKTAFQNAEPETKAAIVTALEVGTQVGLDPLNALAGIGALKRVAPLTKKGAEKTLRKLEIKANEYVGQGLDTTTALHKAANDLKLPESNVQKALDKAGRKLRVKAGNSTPSPTAAVGTSSTNAAPVISKAGIAASNQRPVQRFERVRDSIDKTVQPMYSRIKEKSPRLAYRLRSFEHRNDLRRDKLLTEVGDYGKAYDKLSKKDRQRVDLAVFNSDTTKIQDLIQKYPKLDAGLKARRKVLDDLAAEQKAAGYDFKFLNDYHPTVVNDIRGLIRQDGGEHGGRLGRLIEEAEKKKGAALSNDELTKIVQRSSTGDFQSATLSPLHFKERTRARVGPNDLKFYQNSAESLKTYITNTVQNLERQRLFGTKYGENASDSIDKLIGKEVQSGALHRADADEVIDLLKTRFIDAERRGSKAVGTLRSLLYLDTLGQPTSAVTQLGDLGPAAYINGLGNTVHSAIREVFGKGLVKKEDLGISDIAKDFVTTGGAGRVLDKVLGLTQFKRVDRFGKNTLINSSLRRLRKQVKSAKGQKAIAEKYKDAIPAYEYQQLIGDLRAGRITGRVKEVLFNELSDLQPVTLTEMPERYAKHPNGRILYSLLSFMLKQVDLLRNQSLKKLTTKGERVQGAKNLMKLGVLLSAANMGAEEIKNVIRGRPVFDKGLTFERVALNMIKNYGLSEYTARDLKSGALLEAVAPAYSVAVDTAKEGFDVADLALDSVGIADDESEQSQQTQKARVIRNATRHIPVLGQFLYDWFGGGIENYNEQMKKDKEGDF